MKWTKKEPNKNRKINEKVIWTVLWTVLCGIITVIAFLYVGPFDGLSRNYHCQYPTEMQPFTVASDEAFEEEVMFDSRYLSAIELYPVGESIPAGVVSVEISEMEGGKKIFAETVRQEIPEGAWTKLEIGKRVKLDEAYRITCRVGEDAALGINIASAIGYRDSLSMKMKAFLVIGILLVGGFMTLAPRYCFYDSFVQEWRGEKAEKRTRHEQISKKVIFCLSAVFVVFIVLSGYRHINRKGNHVDEFLTYTLANNTQYTELPLNQKITDVQGVLDRFFTVNETNRAFNYAGVWENQHSDTHPPFYYVLVHTISSLFPGKFSWWFAYSINLAFGCLILFYLYKMCRMLGTSELTGLMAALLLAVNPAFLEMSIFLRMYIMVMFFCLLLLYWVVKNWGEFNLRFLIGNMLIFVLGTMTHYYFIVYAFFVYSMIGVYCLMYRENKTFFRLIYSMILAGGVALLIFPGIVYHLTNGGRGTENIANFLSASDYGERFRTFLGFVNNNLFGGSLLIVGLLSLIGYAFKWKCEKPENRLVWQVMTILVSVLCYFIVVSKVASYLEQRYISLIYPESFLFVWLGCAWLIKYGMIQCGMKRGQKMAVLLVGGGIFLIAETVGSKYYDWSYSAEVYADIEPKVEKVSANECICYFNNLWEIWTSYQELIKYPSVTLIHDGREKDIDTKAYGGDELVIYMAISIEKERREDILRKYDCYSKRSAIHEGYSYCDAYVLD